MKNYLFLLAFAALFTSCQTLVLGEHEANDPENSFDIFWGDFDKHYGLFTVRGWNWDSIRTEFEPQVTPETTDEELFEIFSNMIATLDDSHTFVYWPNQAFFTSGSELDDQAGAEFSFDVIQENYLEIIDSASKAGYAYGNLRNHNIGYLYLAGFDADSQDWVDQMMTDIGDQEAIIIDLRNNTGGDDNAGAALAGRFADREELVYTVQERNGPVHTDFAEKTEYFTRKIGAQQFTRPVVMLTDNITVSAAEVFLIYMNSFDHVTQIGTPTSGDFSDTSMRRFLPNGFQYQYSIMKFLLPDGTSLDGVGHIPDIEIRNSVDELDTGNDEVLERAFRFLFEEYGIE
jgi:C-terminal processing protease CtpA/Prc